MIDIKEEAKQRLLERFEKYDQAKKLALEYSRKIPMRACSPYGHLDTDDQKIKEAFRLCYEVLVREQP